MHPRTPSVRGPRASVGALALLALALVPAAAVAQHVAYSRAPDGGWLRHEQGLAFPVNPDVVTVRFHGGALDDLSARVADLRSGSPLLEGLALLRANRLGFVDLSVPAGRDPLALVAALRQHPGIELAEETVRGFYVATPDDPLYPQQWHLHNTGQTGGASDADVDAPEAWDLEDGDPSVAVAVLDSGTQWSHPDLAANIWSNADEVVNGVDDDGNGYVDDVRGWDFDNDDNDPAGTFFHGTAVASVVAADSDNGQQVAGLAGGASDGVGCRVMACNVGSFSPDGSVLDDAILYAADNGARVITLSLTVGASAAIDAALVAAHDAGVFIDCAAGNSGFSVTYPANHPRVMAVGATNHLDVGASFSNPGPEVEVSAPGQGILMLNLGGGTTTSDGTSFSAPMVGALAALLFSADPGLSNEEVRQIIKDTADDVGAPGFDTVTGWGRINAAAAIGALDGFVPGAVVAYGQGLAGTGGQEPLIVVAGAPHVGQADFRVALSQARPSATAWLLAGLSQAAFPFAGGTLLVDITVADHLLLPTLTNGVGRGSMPLPIPDEPVLLEVDVFVQWAIDDPEAPFGWALSEGLQLTIGS